MAGNALIVAYSSVRKHARKDTGSTTELVSTVSVSSKENKHVCIQLPVGSP